MADDPSTAEENFNPAPEDSMDVAPAPKDTMDVAPSPEDTMEVIDPEAQPSITVDLD